MGTLSTILLSCIGSSGLFAFIEFLINRKDSTKDRLDKIEKNQQKSERDLVRTQMLIMMNHYPEDTNEIMKLGEHYFADLNGDWYMTSLFNKWLERANIGKPEWFKED